MRMRYQKNTNSKIISEERIAFLIEHNIELKLKEQKNIFHRNKRNNIKKSILFEKTIHFYTNTLISSNDIIKLKISRQLTQPIAKEKLIKSLIYYIMNKINIIPKKNNFYKSTFICKQNFSNKEIFNQVTNIVNDYIENCSISDTWNIMLQDIKYGLELREYKNRKSSTRYSYKKFAKRPNKKNYENIYQHNPNEDFVIYPLLYGTSRKPIKDKLNNIIGYGNERHTCVNYGDCLVKIKKSNKLGGEINKSFLLKLWDTIFNNDLENRSISIESLEHFDINMFHDKLNFLYSSANENEMLIYIHGYKNSFSDAAERAAQIAYDLKFPGVTSFFSWASKNETLGYMADEATAEISTKYLYEYIQNIWKNSSTKKIHIIAHSMGNRILMNTLKEIKNKNTSIKFGHIILVAPDVDTELFRDNSYLYNQYSEMTTLYVSPNDDAIKKSYILHGENRVGLSPPVVIEKGIYTINVNQIMAQALWDFGHSYYAEAEALLYDLHELILYSSIPDKRQKLEIVTVNSDKYWQLNII